MEESIRKADILIEALPYLQAFRGKVIVAKYGGSAIDNPAAIRGILQDLVFLSAVGIHPVLVHGGGPMITRKLSAAGKGTAFIDGMRVTDRETMRIVSQELDAVNRRLTAHVKGLGGHVDGITAHRGAIVARPHPRAAQLGCVGSVQTVRTGALREAFLRQAIPILSPVGKGPDGRLYNINADHVASEVAVRLQAEKFVLLTNVRGILRQPNDVSSLISTLSIRETKILQERQVIQEGMIPKVKACIDALRGGVKKTHIIDAAVPHAMLLEIFTRQGIGTEMIR